MLSRNAQNGPTSIRYPHRLTLPLTALVFLAPWSASNFVGPIDPPRLVAVSEDRHENAPEMPTVELESPVFDPGGSPAISFFVKTAAYAGAYPANRTVRSVSVAIERTARRTQAPLEVLGTPPDPLIPGSQPASRLADHDSVGQAALGQISYDWSSRLTGWTIDFRPGRSSLRGLTFVAERRIEVYVHTGDVWTIAPITAHEIGHALDITLNNTASRRAWKEQRGMEPDAPWWPTAGSHDFVTGSGDFAECFAGTQVGAASRSAYGTCSAADADAMHSMIGS